MLTKEMIKEAARPMVLAVIQELLYEEIMNVKILEADPEPTGGEIPVEREEVCRVPVEEQERFQLDWSNQEKPVKTRKKRVLLTPEQRDRVIGLYAQGWQTKELAALFEISESTAREIRASVQKLSGR